MIPAKCDKPLTGLDYLEWYGPHRVYHPGIDCNEGYGNQDLGNDVVAAKNGYIQYIHEDVRTSGGLGKFVIIKHSSGEYTRYAHLGSIKRVLDPYIEEGTKIGVVGNTGTKYAHLHFEVFNEKMAVIQKKHWRPWRYYPSRKSKQWIKDHYLNPWEWLKKPQELTDLEKGYKWLKDNKFVLHSGPKDEVTVDMLGIILKRYHERFGVCK